MPLGGALSCVAAGAAVAGRGPSYCQFPRWLGKRSTANKNERIVQVRCTPPRCRSLPGCPHGPPDPQELNSVMALNISCTKAVPCNIPWHVHAWRRWV